MNIAVPWLAPLHCKPGQVEPAYIECGNGAAAMQVSQVNLFELDPVPISLLDLLALPQHRSHIQCKLGSTCPGLLCLL